MSAQTNSRSNHAVVIGASVAGLLAAKALSSRFDSVLILDRDSLPEQPVPRKGVPQSFQPHVWLVHGLNCLEELLPGFRKVLLDAGASLQYREDWEFVFLGGRLKQYGSEDTAIGATRGFLEWFLRREVLSTPNIAIRTGMEVDDLLWNDATGAVTGVSLHQRQDRSLIETIGARLVVDATGRKSRISEWLTAAGFEAVPEEVVTSRISYSSRFFRRAGALVDARNVLIQPRPPHNPRLGILMRAEGDLWQVLLGGSAGLETPSDEEGFLQWTRDLAEPDLYLALRMAEPVSPIRGFRVPETRWRHFEKMRRWSAGLIAIGDAVAAFNPIYGQGMSVAAMEAVALKKAVERGMASSWEQASQRTVARIVALPWSLGSGEDMRWEGTFRNDRPANARERILHRYIDRLLVAATRDVAVSRTFVETINLMHGAAALIAPEIVLRTLIHGSGRRSHDIGGAALTAATEAVPR